jgi:hypothetical protein
MAVHNSNNLSPGTQLRDCGVDCAPPLALGIAEVCQQSGLGRTSIYAAIKSGDLVARKWKRRTI